MKEINLNIDTANRVKLKFKYEEAYKYIIIKKLNPQEANSLTHLQKQLQAIPEEERNEKALGVIEEVINAVYIEGDMTVKELLLLPLGAISEIVNAIIKEQGLPDQKKRKSSTESGAE